MSRASARPKPKSAPAAENVSLLTRVLWAIDPFAPDPKPEVRTGGVLRSLADRFPFTVEPAYVAGLEALGASTLAAADSTDPWRRRVDKEIGKIVRSARVPRVRAPQVLVGSGLSTRSSVDELLRYATTANIDCIAVAAHARRGASRLFLGSFAETLLLSSDRPVLVAGHGPRLARSVRRVLVATDFSDRSREAFPWLRSFVHRLGAELHLFHRTLLSPDSQVLHEAAYSFPESLWLGLRSEREKVADQWLAEARRNRVKAALHLSNSHQPISSAIVTAARRLKCDLIALVSHSGSAQATLLGSVARQVVREADRPVLVLPPRFVATRSGG